MPNNPESLQRRHLPLKGRIAEVQLVLLRQVSFRNPFLPRQIVCQLAEARRIPRARRAVRS